MSKGLGQKIIVKFTEALTDPSFIPDLTNNLALGKPYTSNGALDNRGFSATDGNTATANYISSPGTNIYIEVDLEEAVPVSAIKVWHYYSDGRTYYSTKTEVSEDGVEWTTVFDSAIEGTYKETSSGKLHKLAEITNARYVRDWLSGSSANPGNHWVEMMVYGATLGYESESWKVTGEEYQYINGPLIPKEYGVASVKRHPDYTDDKHLMITMHPQSRFNNVEGPLTVQYDRLKGNLQGKAGLVESFETSFIPTDLEPKLNPMITEVFTTYPNVNVAFQKIAYRDRFYDEKFIVSANCNLNFEYVGIINP